VTPLLRRIEALEVANNPVAPLVLVLIESRTTPGRQPVLRASVHGCEMVQGDDESADAFRDRLRAAAKQAPGQAVVLLDKQDIEL
jgi:hypothetical protein